MSGVKVCLIRIQSEEGPRSHLIEKTPFIIGRAQEADLPILSSGVSRLHVQVEFRGDSVWIKDQKSANGTWVNGYRIEPGQEFPVLPTDVVKLGVDQTEFLFMVIAKPFEMMSGEAKKETLIGSMEEIAKQVESDFQSKVEKELRKARLEAEEILSSARKEAEMVRTRSLMDLQTQKRELEAQVALLQQEAKMGSAEMRMNAQREADRLIAEAQKRIQKDYDEANEQMEARFKDVQAKCMQMLEQAEKNGQSILTAANKEASELRHSAVEEARKIQQESLRKSQDSTVALQEGFQKEIERKREEILQTARADAELERLNILKEVQAQDEKRKFLRAENEQMEASRARLTGDLSRLERDLESARRLLQQVNELEERKALAERELKEFELSRANGTARIESEFKELRDKLQVEHEGRKRDQEQELGKNRLQVIEEMKKELERREQEYLKSRRIRALELTQKLQERLIPRLQVWLEAPSSAPSDLKTAIEASVTDCLLSESSSFKPRPDVVENAPPARLEARNRKLMLWVGAAAVVALVSAGLFREQLAAKLKESSENSHATQLLEERRRESVYNPEQSDVFNGSYTDNVLYMKSYFETKTDPLYLEQWTRRLNDLALLRSLSLSEEDAVRFIAKEANLVARLGALRSKIDAKYLNEGIDAMRKAEDEDMVELKSILKTESNFAEVRRLEQESLKAFQGQIAPQGPAPASVGAFGAGGLAPTE